MSLPIKQKIKSFFFRLYGARSEKSFNSRKDEFLTELDKLHEYFYTENNKESVKEIDRIRYYFQQKIDKKIHWALYLRKDCELNTKMSNENYNKMLKPKGEFLDQLFSCFQEFFISSTKS